MIGLGKREIAQPSFLSAARQVHSTRATVSSRVLWPFVASLRRVCVNAQPALAHVQMSEGELRDPDVRVSYANAFSLIEKLVAYSGRSDLGLLAAHEVQQGYFDLLEIALRCAPTVGDAIEHLISFFVLLDDGAEMTLTRGPVLSEMRYVVNCDLSVHPAYVEFLPAMLLIAARRETNVATLGGECIYFQHANAASVDLYQELFRSSVYFNAAENVAIFRSEILTLPFCRANALMEKEAIAAINESITEIEDWTR